ncbi:MAG: PqqD family protein [Acidobacteriota bacterium]|nr:PqqD family protein [Acidobacteriota bacterium]
MTVSVNLEAVYRPSDDVVSREIEGELILIPVASGIGDLEDELYSLNETGKAVWRALDGKKSLRQVAVELAADFAGLPEDIEADVKGLVQELLKRNIVIEVSQG